MAEKMPENVGQKPNMSSVERAKEVLNGLLAGATPNQIMAALKELFKEKAVESDEKDEIPTPMDKIIENQNYS